MKKITIFALAALFIAACAPKKNAENQPESSTEITELQKTPAHDPTFVFDKNGLPDLQLGDLLPAAWQGFPIQKEIRIGEEATEYPAFIVSDGNEVLFEMLTTYDWSTDSYTDTIGEIQFFSPRFADSNGTHVGMNYFDCSPEIQAIEPWWSYVNHDYVTLTTDNVQYCLSIEDVTAELQYIIEGHVIPQSTIKPEAKIQTIRVFKL